VDYIGTRFSFLDSVIEYEHKHEFYPPVQPNDDELTDDNNNPFGFKRREHEKKIDIYLNQKAQNENNKILVYAIIWKQCTQSLQNTLRESTDYQTFTTNRDPLLPLVEITNLCLNGHILHVDEGNRRNDAEQRSRNVRQFLTSTSVIFIIV
jgi:hypothetical protein